MSKTFQSLEQYNYRLWFFGNIFASSGLWMQRVAQDWLVLTVLTEGGGFQVGIVTALQFLPILLFSPWAGLAADRLDRRKLLQTTQSLTALMGVFLGVLVLTGTAQLWMVYILAFAGGVASSFDGPARQAFVSELVPAWMLPNAVALNSTAFNLARMIGPALSGAIVEAVGPGWVFVINGGLFLVPVAALAVMRVDELDVPAPVPREKGQIKEAVRYIQARKDIVLIMIIIGVVSMLGLNFQITSALMATQVFGKQAGSYGLMSTAVALGAFSGSFLVARYSNPRLRVIVLAALGFGTFLGLLAMSPTYLAFLIIAVPMGAIQMTLIATANAAVQISTEAQFRGRVMALYSMIFMGSTPIGAPIVGWIGEHIGARWSIGIGSVATLATALIVAFWGWFVLGIRLQFDGYKIPKLLVPGEDENLTPKERVQATLAEDKTVARNVTEDTGDAEDTEDGKPRESRESKEPGESGAGKPNEPKSSGSKSSEPKSAGSESSEPKTGASETGDQGSSD